MADAADLQECDCPNRALLFSWTRLSPLLGVVMAFSMQVLLVAHFLWAGWMVAGFLFSLAGFKCRWFWRLRFFRTAHLIGLVVTASVPLWNKGICPLTEWEWESRGGTLGEGADSSFILRFMHDVLYLDVSPAVLSITTALAAALTLWIYIAHPPWEKRSKSGSHAHPTG